MKTPLHPLPFYPLAKYVSWSLLLLTLSTNLLADLYYESDGTQITITGGSPDASGDLVIPDTIENLPVTSIGKEAFWWSGLTSLTLSKNLVSIGNLAFAENEGLTNLTIPDGVTSIGYSAFLACWGLSTIEIPENVTSIGYLAFAGCSGLTNVSMGNKVTSIGVYAFEECTSLRNVTIGNSLTSIPHGAFDGCTNLATIVIPDSVTSIGDFAFRKCENLGTIVIPDSVTSIGEFPFESCSGLTAVTIPSCVKSFTETFGDSLWVNSPFGQRIGNNLTSVAFGDSVTSIPPSILKKLAGITNIKIPNSVFSIGEDAFYGCSGLTNVTIPDSVSSIGTGAFYGCSGLTNVTIPDSVSSIGTAAFQDCSGLTNVRISANVTDIPYFTFAGTSLRNLTVPSGVTRIGAYAFGYCFALTNAIIGEDLAMIGYGSFVNCPKLRSVYFLGDAPSTEWEGASPFRTMTEIAPTFPTVYYVKGKVGWEDPPLFGAKAIFPPFITSSVSSTATVGQPFTFTITADDITSINSPTSFDANNLPPGLTFNPLTGVISGVPTTQGNYTLTLFASNVAGQGTHPLSLEIKPPAAPKIGIIYNRTQHRILTSVHGGEDQESQIEYTENLQQWFPLQTKLLGTQDLSQLDPDSTTHPHRFYRLKQ